MATISINVPDALDTAANAHFGGNQPKKDAMKAFLKTEVINGRLRQAAEDARVAEEAARASILGDTTID